MVQAHKGFSLIEILISLAVFAVVITAGSAAVISIIDANQKAQALNSIMTNMHTALEGMARDIRTMQTYESSNGSDITYVDDRGARIRYELRTETDRPDVGVIYKVFPGTSLQSEPITSSEIDIDSLQFIPVTAGNRQPIVHIRISGKAGTQVGTAASFRLQTAVTQRVIDEI